MNLTPQEIEQLRATLPDLAAKIEAGQAAEAERLSELSLLDTEAPARPQPDPEVAFNGVIVIAGEGERDQDPVARGCAACDRGGVPRRGAPHSCGLPNPPGLGDRVRW